MNGLGISIAVLSLVAGFANADELPLTKVPVSQTNRDLPIEEGINPKKRVSAPNYVQRMPLPFKYESDEKDGLFAFTISGKNSTEVLQRMSTITGLDIDILEKRMVGTGSKDTGQMMGGDKLPEWLGANNVLMRNSGAGFITHKQRLREILMFDNDSVLSWNLTHQDLAHPLISITEYIEEHDLNSAEHITVRRNGKPTSAYKYDFSGKTYGIITSRMGGEIYYDGFPDFSKKMVDPRLKLMSGWIGRGTQGSPFNDELFANWTFVVIDPSTNGILECDALTPYLIHRYGFYQGGPYRVAPCSIAKFFGLLKGSCNLNEDEFKRVFPL